MIGKSILHYKILEKLGEGGMGVVYKALDTKLNREVAIKFLPHHIAPSEEERQRFKIEAQAAAALNRPNIATIYAVEEVDGETFIVMEYIKGRELKDIIHSNLPKCLDLRKVLKYAIQIVEGLQTAHEEGVIHRDIKSANIMITEKDQVKIMDFGLAKVRGGDELTKEHSTLGTAAYMPPEQALGEKNIDHRTDIWSFGVVLYEMLTGKLPFQGEYHSAVLYSIMNEEPDPIRSSRIDVPIELEQAVHKCLEKKRDNRYPSIPHLLADLKHVKKALDSDGRVASGVQPLRKVKTRKRIAGFVFTAAALLPVFVLVTTGLNIFKTRTPEPRIVQTRQLTTTTTIWETNPVLSSDGTRIAYNSDETGNWDIWVQQLASGDKINLTKDYQGNDLGPVWSPDGHSIAFVSDRDGGGIFIMSEYGGLARQIVAHSSKEIGVSSWSPDGKRLAYGIAHPDGTRIYTVAIAGGTPTEIPLPEPGYRAT
jgi:serine/threonine protein kinase